MKRKKRLITKIMNYEFFSRIYLEIYGRSSVDDETESSQPLL